MIFFVEKDQDWFAFFHAQGVYSPVSGPHACRVIILITLPYCWELLPREALSFSLFHHIKNWTSCYVELTTRSRLEETVMRNSWVTRPLGVLALKKSSPGPYRTVHELSVISPSITHG